MIKIMKQGAGFSLIAVTCDITRRMGGARIELQHCRKVGSNVSDRDHGTVTVVESDRKGGHPILLHTCLIESINGMTVL